MQTKQAKKWSATHRIWHWLNALVIMALIVTALLRNTDLSDAVNPLHVVLGIALFVLFTIRVIRMLFNKEYLFFTNTIEYTTKSLKIMKSTFIPKSAEDFHCFHKAGVCSSYIIIYLSIAASSLTGLALFLINKYDLSSFDTNILSEVHEFSFIVFCIFIPLHLGGVIMAEITNEPNIVSDMINGGKPI